MEVDKLTIVLVLLAAIWGGMAQVMGIIKWRNEIRDRVLGVGQPVSNTLIGSTHAKLLLWSDYVPIWVGTVLFLGLFAATFWSLPSILTDKQVQLKEWEFWLTRGAAIFTSFGLLADLVAGIVEVLRMREHIRSLEHTEKKPQA
jgi:hypothetical protein